MDTKPLPPTVFISYASPDVERAFEVCEQLEALGHTCWIAPRNIRAGHDYGEEIIRGIEQARCFVLILSSAANESIYVKREVERAVAKAKNVFPLRIEDVSPSPALELHLASLHYLDASRGVLRDHVIMLANHLTDRLNESYPLTPINHPPVWWRKPSTLAAGSAAAVILLIWWLYPLLLKSSPMPPTVQPSRPPNAVDTATRISNVREKPTLKNCGRFASGGPVLRCDGGVGSRVHVRSAQGQEVIVPGAIGGNNVAPGTIYSNSTFLPWLGAGSTAREETAAGVLSVEQPLPDLPNVAAAVNVASSDKNAPPLFYALTEQKPNGVWSYLFFAPLETTDVEWSTDSSGFIRVEKMGWQTQMGGPFWLDATALGNKSIDIRWRKGTDEWSAPAHYSADVSAARITSVKPLQDLADSIVCFRDVDTIYPPHVRCRSRRNVNLGEIFDDLRWGTNASELKPVDDFDFKQWASDVMQATLEQLQPPKVTTHADCKGDQHCESYARQNEMTTYNNRKTGLARSLEMSIQNNALYFGSWKTRDRSPWYFLAILPVRDDVYFQATPRGGGSPLTARIGVSDHDPR